MQTEVNTHSTFRYDDSLLLIQLLGDWSLRGGLQSFQTDIQASGLKDPAQATGIHILANDLGEWDSSILVYIEH